MFDWRSLRPIRAAKGVTLRQVEAATGLSNAYLSQLETGKVKSPSVAVASKLAAYYGRPIAGFRAPSNAAAYSPLKVAFDIGGVLSKYPERFRRMAMALHVSPDVEVHVITDMHERESTLEHLLANGFGFIPADRVHNADYAGLGEMCKAVILRDLGIDVLIDDFGGYTAWDSSFGPAPIRCLVQPDPFRPYWAEGWKTGDDHQFGRRVFTQSAKETSDDAK